MQFRRNIWSEIWFNTKVSSYLNCFEIAVMYINRYASRTSSAHWDADELTPVEKRQYRAHMGYDAAHKIQV